MTKLWNTLHPIAAGVMHTLFDILGPGGPLFAVGDVGTLVRSDDDGGELFSTLRPGEFDKDLELWRAPLLRRRFRGDTAADSVLRPTAYPRAGGR